MLEFFIQNAWAEEAPSQGGGIMGLLPLILIFVVFYFFLIRPQMKQAKEHKQMVEALTKGDEVVTTGGLLGKINKVGDNFIILEIAKDIEVKVQKHAVSATMPKGTIKTL
ncbi:MAG: preprotein translocase subunit YajC [Gammaproteobacteria bacterium]|nr:preprotein translocase subunit YajC [Gammaproteobacteria bacterium]